MKPPENYFLFLAWLVLALVATAVALFMIERRGKRAVVFAVLMIVGAAATYPLFHSPFTWNKAGLGSVGLLIIGCSTIGFRPRRLRPDRCPACGYQLIGEDERSSTRCPECGEATLPHHACPNCGYYKGRKVIETDED